MTLHLLERTLCFRLFTSLVACRCFFKSVALVMETTKNTLWTLLMACSVMATLHVTSPDCLHRNLLHSDKWKKVVCNMVSDVLDKAPGLLHKLSLGFDIKVWASQVGPTAMMAHHNGVKLFALGLLLSPWVGACLVAYVVMATLHVTNHGLTSHLQLLDCRRL